MTKNPGVDHFCNSALIQEFQYGEERNIAGKERRSARCYYDNDSENGKIWKLFNGYAVNDPGELSL